MNRNFLEDFVERSSDRGFSVSERKTDSAFVERLLCDSFIKHGIHIYESSLKKGAFLVSIGYRVRLVIPETEGSALEYSNFIHEDMGSNGIFPSGWHIQTPWEDMDALIADLDQVSEPWFISRSTIQGVIQDLQTGLEVGIPNDPPSHHVAWSAKIFSKIFLQSSKGHEKVHRRPPIYNCYLANAFAELGDVDQAISYAKRWVSIQNNLKANRPYENWIKKHERNRAKEPSQTTIKQPD